MTFDNVFEGHSIKTTQVMQKGTLVALAVAAGLILTFGRHNLVMVGVVLAICMVIAPAAYVLGKRLMHTVRQRETESRLLMYTRLYLSQQPEFVAKAVPSASEIDWQADIEILARAIDGKRLPTQDFRSFQVTISPAKEGVPAVFSALPGREAINDAPVTLPRAVCVPFAELLVGPDMQEVAS